MMATSWRRTRDVQHRGTVSRVQYLLFQNLAKIREPATVCRGLPQRHEGACHVPRQHLREGGGSFLQHDVRGWPSTGDIKKNVSDARGKGDGIKVGVSTHRAS